MILLQAEGLAKAFTLHLQGGARIPVLADAGLAIAAGECVALSGPSGAGKSTLMRCLYGNYRVDAGHVLVRHRGALVDIARADPRLVLEVRRESIGYVSQFLRVVPRVSALDIVREAGGDAALLSRLNIARAPAGPAARDVLRRRAAAGQHRPRAGRRPQGAAAGRTHRLARSGQPGRRDRHDHRGEGAGCRDHRNIS